MEHSYTRDWQLNENIEVMATRTILIDRPPQCPSCHQSPNEDKLDAPDTGNPPIPTYNEDAGRIAMDEAERLVRNSSNKNNRSDDEDWEARINKLGWTEQHHNLFRRVERLLDLDQMARLALKDRPNECLRRRGVIEKSVSRMRQALASVQWNSRMAQWLHGLLSNHLPPSYTVSYIEILQALKRKQPMLVDKMLGGRTIDQDYMSIVVKRPWEPTIATKDRKLPGQAVIVVLPSLPSIAVPSPRLQRWHQLFGTLATVVPIQVNLNQSSLQKQSFDQISEQMVTISRAKIQELRTEVPNRQIVLVGFNAGAALAVQVGLVETVSSIVCLGLSYNTVNGVRGAPDDRILQITTPILFVLGQVAQRSSQEEMESLREKMSAQTSLVVVGNADDSLRVSRLNRQMEGVTQSMIDTMITDEIQEFASTCIVNPPGPRQPTLNNAISDGLLGRAVLLTSNSNTPPLAKKSKLTDPYEHTKPKQLKGRPRLNRPHQPVKKPKNPKRLLNTSNEALQMAIDSILPVTATATPIATTTTEDIPPLRPISSTATATTTDGSEIISTFEVVASGSGQTNLQTLKPIQNKGHIGPTAKSQIGAPPPNITQMKFVPSNQFVHIKPPPLNTQKIYMKTPKGTVNSAQPITFRVAPSSTTTDVKGAPVANKLITVKSKGVGQQILTATSYDRLVQQQRLTQPQVSSATTTVVSSAGAKFAIIKQGPGGQTIQGHIQGQMHNQPQIQGQMTMQHQPPITASIQSGQLQAQQIQIQGQIGKVQTTMASVPQQPSSIATITRQVTTTPIGGGEVMDFLDLPILFADQDGNIDDNHQISTTVEHPLKETATVFTTPTAPSGNYIVIASTQAGGIKPTLIQNHRPIMVNSFTPSNSLAKVTTTSQNSKFVVINRSNLNQMKPATANVMTTNRAPIKYSKMMLPTSDIMTSMAGKTLVTSTTTGTTLTPGTKIDISSLVKSGTVTTKNATRVAATTAAGKPIIINIESDKNTFKNVIKIPSSEVPQLNTPSNSIVLKQGDLRTVGNVSALKAGILNRNITVRKINIIQQPTHTSVPATVTSTTMATSNVLGRSQQGSGGNE